MAHVPPATAVLLTALFLITFKEAEAEAGAERLPKVRQKREWFVPPFKLKENFDYGNRTISKIMSDKQNIIYSLEGEGANDVFIIDPKSGAVYVTKKLDREQKSEYILTGVAKYVNRTKAEPDLPLRISVLDENDCAPEFGVIPVGQVNESSAAGTFVMQVNVTDRDDPASENAKIAFRITGQNSDHNTMFRINRTTGAIYVHLPTLDREVRDKYTLTLEASDLDGMPHGKTASATITINILDINDNIPTLLNESYEGSVEENRANVEVVRIKAVDKDLVGSDNWLAVFTIESGNEAKYFSITTDSKTNEGILMLHKPLDYEQQKEVDLKISVANKAEYHITTTEIQKRYSLKIKVKNQPEGPTFMPRVKAVNVTEGIETLLHAVIVTYPAVDGDTFEIVKNVRYAKGKDPENWLTINETTAEVRLNKIPDRESKHLQNGTYYVEIICITSGKYIPRYTATGTIAVMVEDSNDHCPQLAPTVQTVCAEKNIVYVTAHDEDLAPNSAPFQFAVVSEKHRRLWGVERINDTTVLLRAHKPLWPGSHQLALNIYDQQGKSCDHSQVVKFHVCTCNKDNTCSWSGKPRATFGTRGISLLLLGLLLLLLLVPLLLLFCTCVGLPKRHFEEIPFDPVPLLSSGNTEEKKANSAAERSHTKDVSLLFHEEGCGSSEGSVGCCSFIEVDNDLEFLNDLHPKFKILAEICSGSVMETAVFSSVSGTGALRPADRHGPSPSRTPAERTGFEASQAGVSRAAHSVTTTLVEEVHSSDVGTPAPAHRSVQVPKQTYVLQPQPVLVVEPCVPPTVFLSEMPGMYTVSNTPTPVTHGTLSRTDKVLLLEKSAAESSYSVQRDRDTGGTQHVLLVEGQAGPAAGINIRLLAEKDTQAVGGLLRSPDILLASQQVQQESWSTSALHRAEASNSPSMVSGASSSHREVLGLHSSPLRGERWPGAHKVLVQEKKVSATERSLQGNTTG
ncbi:desmoglein-2-like [Arapaima gigas]